MFPDRYRGRYDPPQQSDIWQAAGLAAIAGLTVFALYQSQTRNRVAHRPPDDAPPRTARGSGRGRAVTGRTVTIDRPRGEVYDFWRDFTNLPHVMENVREITVQGDLTRWSIEAPGKGTADLVTRIVDDRPGEAISWVSTESSDIAHEGRVTFRDAPGGRGTEVSLILRYDAPAGMLGRAIAKMLQAEPHLQARRDLKRLKMLLETGEIATNANRRSAA
ncbi:SRPBCC family protein [Palleronia abyssalis]|uniref:Ribosome association toxin RatA n=1 Tax=Palleronia abyssalis TaxID=1501240 RepID=A0A2R8BUR6_9RHOB|nr:SRPBCC family protein [Palleronia abyssalis]SPJ23909.1 hypothetical protein PAA8504_01729 [Palleronia abyssalis]